MATFGGGASSTPAFNFGGPPAKAPAPLSLGGFGTSASVTTSATPAFGGFGAPAKTSTGFGGFGASATTATPALGGFGAPATSAPPLGGFGAPASSAPALGGFGAPAASTASSFGGFGTAPAASSTAPTLNFGVPAATSVPSLGFGVAASSSSTLSFGTTATSAPSVGLGGNTSAPALSLGLGGVSQGGSQSGAAVQGAAQDQGKVGKESVVPQELGVTVEELKTFVKAEKDVSSEVSHLSDKQFKRIKEDTETLSQLVSVLATGVQQNKGKLDRLKQRSGQELVNVEIAVRTRDTPASMQYENTAPTDYFVRLIAQFETQMQSYRKQIEQTEQHLQVLGSGGSITSEDIVAAVQKLHSAFTDLAARYQGLHQAVAAEKATYSQLHRSLHGCSGTGALFESKTIQDRKQNVSLPKLAGPSPFTAPTDPLVQARNSVLNRNQPGPPTMALSSVAPTGTFGSLGTSNTTFGANPAPAFGTTNTFGAAPNVGFGASNTTFGAAGNTSSAFGANPAGTTFGSPGFGSSGFGGGGGSSFGSSTFGASTPITGNKRNKH